MRSIFYKHSKCINGCKLFNDDSNYCYWEKKQTTSDEVEIVNFLNNSYPSKSLKILHIGIGNSHIALKLKNYKKIDGITISANEINYAKSLNIKNYNLFFMNKYTRDTFTNEFFRNYDAIIDVNLKSFSCCELAFNNLFSTYNSMLNNYGKIFSGKKGMRWSRMVKPKFSFSFKNFFYMRLKEYDGKKSNVLTVSQCEELGKKYNLNFFNNKNTNVVYFSKGND